LPKISRIQKKKLPIDLAKAYCIYLFCKADTWWTSICNELPEVSREGIRKICTSPGWEAETNWMARENFEKKAREAAFLIKEGRSIELFPIPDEIMPFLGKRVIEESREGIIYDSGGRESTSEEIMGEQVPDSRETMALANKAGAGAEQAMRTIAELLAAESLAVPTKVGFELLPIPFTTSRITKDDDLGDVKEPIQYIGGVVMMGRPWEKSFIVPDRDAHFKGVKLAKEVLGITDKDQLELIVKKQKALRDKIEGEVKEKERKRKYEEISRLERETGPKEVQGTVIHFKQVKQKTPQQILLEEKKRNEQITDV